MKLMHYDFSGEVVGLCDKYMTVFSSFVITEISSG
jgi:hypothetical protein